VRFRPADFAVLAICAALTVWCAVTVYSGGGRATLRLQSGGESWLYPLNENREIVIPGPLGDTVVEVKSGQARVISSPCMNKTCVSSGAIHRHGQWIACLPNGVSLVVEGAAQNEADAAAW
jgi:hypothetical protein